MAFVTFVKEESEKYTDYQSFNRLYYYFLEEFMIDLFPEVQHLFNFKSVTIMQEHIPFFQNDEENQYEIVMQVDLKQTEEKVILYVVHQQSMSVDLHVRISQSFRLLAEKYRLKVIPIVIVTQQASTRRQVCMVQQEAVTFRYFIVNVDRDNWSQYLQRNNPIIAGILHKMNYSEKEHTQLTIEILRMIIRMQVKPEERRLLYEYFTE